MTTSRTEVLEDTVRVLSTTLKEIASDACEYEYADKQKERPYPCDCKPCSAKAVLRQVRDYRFIGSRPERLENGHNPREVKIHAAWKGYATDRELGMILYRGPYEYGSPRDFIEEPSPRDWYVATSVVQWLATNVGMSILKAAGFEYTEFEHDRATYEAKRADQYGMRFEPYELKALVMYLQGTARDAPELRSLFPGDKHHETFSKKLDALAELVAPKVETK